MGRGELCAQAPPAGRDPLLQGTGEHSRERAEAHQEPIRQKGVRLLGQLSGMSEDMHASFIFLFPIAVLR